MRARRRFEMKRTTIQTIRKEQRLSQEELAVRVGVSRGWLATIERAPALASPAALQRVAAALRVKPEALLREGV
jgi:transcriptional regulator with XRE-family HTH domain